jgi:copper resistance protein C
MKTNSSRALELLGGSNGSAQFRCGGWERRFLCTALTDFCPDGVLLVRAEPGVGLTVTGPVRELRLFFDQGALTVSSSVQVTNSAGVAIPTTKPIGDPSDQQIVIVHFGRVLLPGTYRVSWHVVSIDQHPASGTFRFTVS